MTLNDDRICNSNFHLEHLQYKVQDDKVIFSDRYYELYLVDYLEDLGVEVGTMVHHLHAAKQVNDMDTDLRWCSIDPKTEQILNRAGKPVASINTLYEKQHYSFNQDVWFEDFKTKMPNALVCKTELLLIDDADMNELEQHRLRRYHTNTGNNNNKPLRHKLEHRLEKAMKRISGGNKDCAFFVKLSSVSPKDIQGSYGKMLKFTSAEQMINALVDSERTYRTLSSGWDRCIVLREWVDLPENHEFRCFIHKSQLRAISQYGDEYVEEFQSEAARKDIIDRISKFYKAIFDCVPYEDCTMDVVLWNDKKQESVGQLGIFLIEFNCFGAATSAGSALFHWIRDWDTLYNSDEPVLRILEKPLMAL